MCTKIYRQTLEILQSVCDILQEAMPSVRPGENAPSQPGLRALEEGDDCVALQLHHSTISLPLSCHLNAYILCVQHSHCDILMQFASDQNYAITLCSYKILAKFNSGQLHTRG